MAYVEAHASLRDHPKTKKLARLLGISRAQAIGHMLCLWWWAQEYADDGNLSAYELADIAEAADWDGNATVFVDALLSCGTKDRAGFLVNHAEEGLKINDWMEYGGKLTVKRQMAKERMRTLRSKEKDVTRTFAEHSHNVNGTLSDVTHIDQSRVDQSREEKSREEKSIKNSEAQATLVASPQRRQSAAKRSPHHDHPAVQAYHDMHNRWPQTAQMALIAERNPPIGEWVRALRAWAGKGYNPANIAGILEWAENPNRLETAEAVKVTTNNGKPDYNAGKWVFNPPPDYTQND